MAEKKAAWFAKGEEGRAKAKQADEEAKQRGEKAFRRFRLEKDSSALITHLDTPDFFFYEHQLKLGPKTFRNVTCIRDSDNCPLDEQGLNPGYVLAGTVISHKPWKDKAGKIHKNQKQLIVYKGKARETILRKIEKNEGNIQYCVFEMSRGSSQTECATGEDMEFKKRLTAKEVKMLTPAGQDPNEFIKPFDYAEEFAPLTAKELRKIAGQAAPVGAEDDDEDSPLKGKENGKGKKDEEEDDDEKGTGGKSIEDII